MGAQHTRRVSPEAGAVAPASDVAVMQDVETGVAGLETLPQLPTTSPDVEPAAAAAVTEPTTTTTRDVAVVHKLYANPMYRDQNPSFEPATAAATAEPTTTRDVAMMRKLYANPMYRAKNPSFELHKAAQSRRRRRPVKTVQEGEPE